MEAKDKLIEEAIWLDGWGATDLARKAEKAHPREFAEHYSKKSGIQYYLTSVPRILNVAIKLQDFNSNVIGILINFEEDVIILTGVDKTEFSEVVSVVDKHVNANMLTKALSTTEYKSIHKTNFRELCMYENDTYKVLYKY